MSAPFKVRRFNDSPLESVIESWFRDKVKERGGRAFKFTSPGQVSVPDRLVLLPGGRMFFVELKRKGKKQTPKQLVMAAEIGAFGFRVYVADSKEACMKILEAEDPDWL